jgi:hypothetical protein
MKVVKMVEYGEYPEAPVGGLGGFFQDGMRWEDYVGAHKEQDKVIPYLNAIRECVLNLKIKHGGDWHQNDPEGTFLFEDGTAPEFSFRAWGDLMAAIWSSEENKDYSYMDFYMEGWGVLE